MINVIGGTTPLTCAHVSVLLIHTNRGVDCGIVKDMVLSAPTENPRYMLLVNFLDCTGSPHSYEASQHQLAVLGLSLGKVLSEWSDGIVLESR